MVKVIRGVVGQVEEQTHIVHGTVLLKVRLKEPGCLHVYLVTDRRETSLQSQSGPSIKVTQCAVTNAEHGLFSEVVSSCLSLEMTNSQWAAVTQQVQEGVHYVTYVTSRGCGRIDPQT